LNPLLPDALVAWRQLLGAEYVSTDSADLREAGRATFATTQQVGAVIHPADTAQVQGCLRIATRYCVPVHPISRGRNWGLGSRVPTVDGAVVLDLGRMDRILAVDEDMACITVEPGVTFRQVHAHLRDRGSRLFSAAIGGAADASLIGNALERGDGVGPYRNRAVSTGAMEVVLPTGDRLETALNRWPEATAGSLHRAGLGPELGGLFLQSNLGVVTRMTFWLAPRPAFLQVFMLKIHGLDALSNVLEAARDLIQQGVLGEAGFTFWNHLKLMAREAQYPWTQTENRTPLHPQERQASAWYASGAHYAAGRTLGLAARELISSALEPWAEVTVFDSDSHGPALADSLFMGVPSDANLASAYWRKRTLPPLQDLDLDRDGCGVLFVCPVMPLRGPIVTAMLPELEELIERHGFEPNIGMHIEAGRTLPAYIALMYDRDVPGEDARALACHDALLDLLLVRGHYPFRLAHPAQGRLPIPADDTTAVMARLKSALDPAGVLSPGRYAFGQPGPLTSVSGASSISPNTTQLMRSCAQPNPHHE
jgi:4-cresol dehydrogenase (hydroxylating) flavoprotein subunit